MALSAVVVLFFLDIVFLGRTLLTSPQAEPVTGFSVGRVQFNPYILDPVASALGHEPLFKKMSALLRHGQIPLWNADSGLGRPLLGSSSPLDSPLRLPLLLWPSPAMWDLFLLSRFLVAGLFTYLLAKRLGCERVGAFGAAVAYPFTGYFMLRVNMGHVDFAMLIPVVLYAMELLVERRSPGRVAFAAAAVGLGILCDNPETLVLIVLLAAAYFVARAITESTGRRLGARLRKSLPVVPVLLSGAALTAFATVPFLTMTGYLGPQSLAINLHQRISGLGLRSDPFPRMILFFLPFIKGAPLRSFDGGLTFLRDYTGIVMPMLGLTALWNRRYMRRAGWFFGLATILTLSKLYGLAPINWLGRIPVLDKVAFPRYITPIATFSLAMLAAGGIDHIARGRIRPWRLILPGACVASLVGLLLFLYRDQLVFIPYRQLAFAGLLLLIAVALAVGNGRLQLRGRLFRHAAISLVALMSIELFAFTLPTKGELGGLARVLYPAAIPLVQRPPRQDVFVASDFVEFLRRDRSVFRVYGLDNTLRGNASAALGLQSIVELNAVKLNRTVAFLRRFIFVSRDELPVGQPMGQGALSPVLVGNRMFDLLNVKYVVTLRTDLANLAPEQYERVYDGQVHIFRNKDVLPRSFVVHQIRTAPDAGSAMRLLEDAAVDPSEEAVVEGSLPAGEAATLSGGVGGTSSVRIITYRDSRVELSVRTDRPGMLVLTDAYHPGWKATADGAPTPVFATDGAFRSVFVTAGDHLVAFSYAPGTFKAGVAISALSLLSLVVYAAWEARRRARSSGRPTPAGPDPPGPMTPGTSPAEEPPGPGPTGSDPERARAPPA